MTTVPDSEDDDSEDGDCQRLSAAALRTIFHSVNDAIFVHDAETGAIIDVNETMCELYGYSREEARALTVEELSSGEPPYTQKQAVENVRKAARGEPHVSEWHARDSDGELFWVEVSMRRAYVGEELRILVIARDITERAEYAQHVEQQRDGLELLNSVVRHDIRNHLQLIDAYTELLGDGGGDDHDRQRYRAMIRQATADAVDLTTTARELSEVMLQPDPEPEPVDLRPVLEAEITAVGLSYPEAEITIQGPLPETTVLANELFDAVFRNLLKNAIQHNRTDSPGVWVSVECLDGTVEIRIADDGPGVSDAHKETIFGKGNQGLGSDGTGIGLYLVASLVEGYGGEVWVEDRVGEGSTGKQPQAGESDSTGSVFVVRLTRCE